ncbi:leukocyte elastase inhibitor-like [Oratosquilla oratoria]|uniref:leukocyte elastase inhibitor-like n=1 Tax=Oratosquilla oratoria TaxID=337810 RepID=UPI003F766C11
MARYLLLAVLVVLETCWAMPQVGDFSNSFHAFTQPSPPIVPRAVQSLTLDLAFESWAAGNTGNVMMSPLSVASVLTLLMLGANNSTHNELQVLLHYSGAVNEDELHEEYADILSELARTDRGIIVNLANRIYVQTGIQVRSSYTRIAESHYDAKVRALDFKRQPNEARNTINTWVNKKTKGKIPDLLKQPLSSDTSVVAVNTLFFNGSWLYPFPVKDTAIGNFRVGNNNNDVVEVPMMRAPIKADYAVISQLDAEIIALPYTGNEFAMYILMPRGDDNLLTRLYGIEQSLTPESLQHILASMKPTLLNVHLPRFSLQHEIYLKDTISKLLDNKVSMFGTSADFSNMVVSRDTYLTDVVHRVVVEVTETGTVAAAATAATLTRLGPSAEFIANKPFLIFIRDIPQDLTLFWGRVVNPEPVI